MNPIRIKEYLDQAQKYADKESGCCKVAVGALLLPSRHKVTLLGANITLPKSCRVAGCRRVDLYGEDSKNHRLPSDCRSLHSEIAVISEAAKYGMSTDRATLFVTRYPCEACARTIVNAGISTVYYGREQVISEETAKIFKSHNVKVEHISSWTYEDTER